MVDLGYYSNRLDELEQRKAEVTGKLVSAKLSLKGINNEIEACKEAMDNLTSPVDTEKSIREIKFFQQSEKITELKQDIARLKDWNDYLKNHCKDLEHELDIKSHELELYEISDNHHIVSEDNIFREFVEIDEDAV